MRAIAQLALAGLTACMLEQFPAVADGSQMVPSFDCSKAKQVYETTICHNHYLSALDNELDTLYSDLTPSDSGRRAHNVWNSLRKDCHADVDCIFDLQMRSYFWMRGPYPWQSWLKDAAKVFKRPSLVGRGGGDLGWGVHLPKIKGACTPSYFAVISDRFGEDPKSPDAAGTTALLSNGGFVTTYGSDRMLIKSRAGDPVEMCLKSLPVDCPPNDERGREYTLTNLRTQEHTTLPDAQHECGGP